MLSGFKLLDDASMWRGEGSRSWAVIDVRYGHASDWKLHVRLEREQIYAEFVFDSVTSFRVHDEGEILEYWGVRDRERIAVGTLYTISESPYRAEIQSGLGRCSMDVLIHYLIAGDDICVEVLATHPPVFRVIDAE